VTSYSIVIPGTPPRKNRRHVIARGRLINSKEFKLFVQALKLAWSAAGHPKIAAGTWALHVHATWPRTRHLDVNVPLGDVDAPISWIMDALQEAGLLDDDARVMELQASKDQGSNPQTLIVLTAL
jgi:Holliday junction resolvase RusA-like endonuclease